MRRIFFDTETTGISIKEKNRIIEIGCVETIDFKKTGNTFRAILNPEREVEEGASKVHGKTWEMLKNEKKFAEVVEEFLQFIANDELIAHNASFDVNFINYELSLLNKPALTNEITDSLMVARKKWPGQPASLDALCKRLEVSNSHRTFHGALLDADLLCEVFIKMVEVGEISTFDYKIKSKSNVYEIKRNTSFPIRKTEISEEELEKHKEFLKSIGFN